MSRIPSGGKLFALLTNTEVPVAAPTTPDSELGRALQHESYRTAQKAKFPNVVGSSETHRVHKSEINDHDELVKKASRLLDRRLQNLYGKGYDFSPLPLKVEAEHKDRFDFSEVTDRAVIPFEVSFPSPKGAPITATFAVTYKTDHDEQFVVASAFDANGQSYELTPANLDKFLNGEFDMKTKTASSSPLAYFDAEAETMLAVATKEPVEKVLGWLQKANFEVSLDWVDSCYDPATFGRLCYRASVAPERKEEFLKIAGMSSEEWVDRSLEKQEKSLPIDRSSPETYVDRSLEKGEYKPDPLKKAEDWADRTLEKDGRDNPYSTEIKLLAAGAVKPATASKQDAMAEVSASLKVLQDILNKA